MPSPRLFHFSENPDIDVFVPRPILVPSNRTLGMDWLNGPLVWAIEEGRQYMYLFPRDCPRIVLWPTKQTTPHDRETWLGESDAVAYIEAHRLEEFSAANIYRYEFVQEAFQDLHDAGMWVSLERSTPIDRTVITDLPTALAACNVELRVVDTLLPLRPLWETTLHVSGIRLRNAVGWVQ